MVVEHKTPNPPPSLPNRVRPTLTEEEQKKYETVLGHFADPKFVVPGVGDGKHTLTEEENFWLTRECILRYLRATKWSEKDAIHRIEETLKWRHEFGYYNDEMTPAGVENEVIAYPRQIGRSAYIPYVSFLGPHRQRARVWL
ncbi:hypothetical protein M407DRAFT_12116 [Tulasnella calospora MUT 4182]|uniref:CRAL/TRIO N-terminal domain-containing protein n=1 Tax=Tulasnella calospora MUT 4182 TaxID=1051891 RepID=A0A0C3PT39_9AGAM|nr:hypothetical protein M407DRAFT_12116 [Tulasnella calospora MUT 4182]